MSQGQPIINPAVAARQVAVITCEALLNPADATKEQLDTYSKYQAVVDAILALPIEEQREKCNSNSVVAALVNVHKKVENLRNGSNSNNNDDGLDAIDWHLNNLEDQKQQLEQQQNNNKKAPRMSKKKKDAEVNKAKQQQQLQTAKEEQCMREARSDAFVRDCRASARFNALPRPGTHSFFGLKSETPAVGGAPQSQQQQSQRIRQREGDNDNDDEGDNARRNAAMFGLDKPVVGGPVFATSIATVAHVLEDKFPAILGSVLRQVQEEEEDDDDGNNCGGALPLALRLDSDASYQIVREIVLLVLHLVRRSSCYAQCEFDLQSLLSEKEEDNTKSRAAAKQPVTSQGAQRRRNSLRLVSNALGDACPVCAKRDGGGVCRACDSARAALDLTRMRTFAPPAAVPGQRKGTSANVIHGDDGAVKLFGVLPVSGNAAKMATESMMV